MSSFAVWLPRADVFGVLKVSAWSESQHTFDAFVDAMVKIAREAKENPQLLKDAPHIAPTRRLDEVRAAKQLILCAPLPNQD